MLALCQCRRCYDPRVKPPRPVPCSKTADQEDLLCRYCRAMRTVGEYNTPNDIDAHSGHVSIEWIRAQPRGTIAPEILELIR